MCWKIKLPTFNKKANYGKENRRKTMGSLMDKIQERKAQEERRTGGYIKQSSLKMRWKDGRNRIRLAGNYVEVHSHIISPSSFGSIGVADASCFKGKGSIPFEVACVDWNLKEEKYHKERTCPFCKLSDRARTALKRPDLRDEEKKIFEKINAACKPSKKLKWNIIDRDAPYYFKVANGKEEKVPGFKFADMSYGMFNDIKGLIEQNGMDITDPQCGIDIVVIKSDTAGRVSYSVQPMLEKGSLKITPFTEEELGWKLIDFVDMYDKPYDFATIKGKMHEDFRIIMEMSDADFLETISTTSETDDDNPLMNDDENLKKN